MQTNFKKIPFLLSIIFFVVLSAGFFFIYTQVDSNNEKAKTATIELENEVNLRNEIKLLNNSIETVKEDRAMLAMHFAESSDIVPFLDTIETLAPKVEAKAETVSVDMPKDGGGLVVKLRVSGSFESIYKFLTLLENSKYELEFTEIEIQKKHETEIIIDAEIEDAPVKAPEWEAMFGVKLLSFTQ